MEKDLESITLQESSSSREDETIRTLRTQAESFLKGTGLFVFKKNAGKMPQEYKGTLYARNPNGIYLNLSKTDEEVEFFPYASISAIYRGIDASDKYQDPILVTRIVESKDGTGWVFTEPNGEQKLVEKVVVTPYSKKNGILPIVKEEYSPD